MSWDPQQYARFSGQRLRPALDLIARIPIEYPKTVVDLGCGTGNVTRVLRERWPRAKVTGIDGSPQMLAEARKLEEGLVWEQCELAAWTPTEQFDLVFSNAALHWLDGHPVLFARLCRNVAAGGVLAVQMPRNFGAPSHTLMHELALSPPWREALAGSLRPQPVLAPDAYYDLLAPQARSLDIWESEYLQILEGENPVAEWTKGTWLAPMLAALSPPARVAFEAEYRRLVAQAYPRRPDGKTLFPFRRLFIVAGL
ncbi:MAG: methyltransferase domain-containing protein [Burkholderiales bacterium]|nr:methyltransferase domain-containing protein [Burkholderiales bacterium]